MATFKHRDGRMVTADEGTKRFEIFERARNWTQVRERGRSRAGYPSPSEDQRASQSLTDKTKAELLTIAGELDIEGRSDMNKAELVAAIAEEQAK